MTRPFLNIIKNGEIIVTDGSTGATLFSRGLKSGELPEAWVLNKPEEITRLHNDFISAGTNIITTCTFCATSIKLEEAHLEKETKRINFRAAEIAREAAKDMIWVAGSIGPTGKLVKPLGPLDENELFDTFAEQSGYLIDGGVDLVVIETQYDITEARLAVEAVRSNSKTIPIVCSFSYDRGTRSMMGVKPEKMWEEIGSQGLVNIAGINCGHSLEQNLKCLQALKAVSTIPIWYKPNAGKPSLDPRGNTVFGVTPDEMGSHVAEWISEGANIVGGCCGTSPKHLESISKAVKQIQAM